MNNGYQNNYNQMNNGFPIQNQKQFSVIKIAGIVGIILITLISLIPFVFSFIMSMSKIKGFTIFSFSGLENYIRALTNPAMPRAMSITVIVGFVSMIVGALYVFVASLSVTSIRNTFLKAAALAVYIIPTVIPTSVYSNVLIRVLHVSAGSISAFATVLDGLRLAGFVIVIALFSKEKPITESVKCMLLFIAVKLIMFWTVDTELFLMLPFQNSPGVLDDYIFRNMFIYVRVSEGQALYILKTLMQLFSAAAGCAIILLTVYKKKPTNISVAPERTVNDKTHPATLSALIGLLIPIVLLLSVLICGIGILPLNNVTMSSCFIGIFIAFVSALMVSVTSFIIAKIASCADAVGFICLTFVVAVGVSFATVYFACINLKILNTFLSVFLINTYMIPFISLLMTYSFKKNHSMLRDLGVFAIFFAVLFGWFWGNSFGSYLTLLDKKLYPVSLLLRNIIFNGQTSFVPNVIVSAFTILLGVAVTVLGCIAASFTLNNKKQSGRFTNSQQPAIIQ